MTIVLILRRNLITFISATGENQGWTDRVSLPPPLSSTPPTQPCMPFTPSLYTLSITPQAPNTFGLNSKLQFDSRPSSWGDGITVDERMCVCVCVCITCSRKAGSLAQASKPSNGEKENKAVDNAPLSNASHHSPAFTHTCNPTTFQHTLSRGLSCKMDLVMGGEEWPWQKTRK